MRVPMESKRIMATNMLALAAKALMAQAQRTIFMRVEQRHMVITTAIRRVAEAAPTMILLTTMATTEVFLVNMDTGIMVMATLTDLTPRILSPERDITMAQPAHTIQIHQCPSAYTIPADQ